jgi:hypothetical protein
MTRYKTLDGGRFDARNADDLVRQLRATSYQHAKTRGEFMREMALRARLWKRDARIDTRSPDAFVRGLIRTGMIQVENDCG